MLSIPCPRPSEHDVGECSDLRGVGVLAFSLVARALSGLAMEHPEASVNENNLPITSLTIPLVS